MNTIDLLIDRLQTARKWTRDLLADIEDACWFDPPAPGVGHVAWQVGHLAASQVVLVHVRCFNRVYTEQVSASFRATPSAAARSPSRTVRPIRRWPTSARRSIVSIASRSI